MDRALPFEFTDEPMYSDDVHVAELPAGLTNTHALLQALYDGLVLPGYFGFNWNALSDSLRDLHWLKERRIVVRHADLPAIPRSDLRNYLLVLADAVASWAPGEEHSLTVIFPLSGESSVAQLMRHEKPDPELPGAGPKRP